MLRLGQEELSRCGLTEKSRVLVGLSGGADSVSLLLLLREAAEEGKIASVCACHVNHGIRGESAARDEAFCASLCGGLGVPIRVARLDVPGLAGERKLSVETAARIARYGALEEARVFIGADCVAVAHHADDQAETVLMHLLRGSGLRGLAGMRPVNGTIVRPLLGRTRAELEAFLREKGVGWVTDETNLSREPVRNRIRLELIPLLRMFNPSVTERLCMLADLAGRDERYLSEEAGRALEKISDEDGSVGIEAMRALPEPIRSRVVIKMIENLGLRDANRAETERVDRLLSAPNGSKCGLHAGYIACTDAGRLRMTAEAGSEAWEAALVPGEAVRTPVGTFESRFLAGNTPPGRDPREAFLDADRLPSGLAVRTRRAGDRFFPLGAPGEKSLSDYFTDRKAARAVRGGPVLAAGSDVVWVPGMTVSDRWKVTEGTKTILHIMITGGEP